METYGRGGSIMKLTKVERLILSNQYSILEKLYPEEAEHYHLQKKIVENGYSLHYDMKI